MKSNYEIMNSKNKQKAKDNKQQTKNNKPKKQQTPNLQNLQTLLTLFCFWAQLSCILSGRTGGTLLGPERCEALQHRSREQKLDGAGHQG